MPEYKLLPFLLICLAAVGAWAVLRHWCGRWGRRYAVAGLSLVLLLGINWLYDLPDYAYLFGILIAPLIFHRTVRGRLDRLARGLPEVAVPELGVRLLRVPDPSGKYVAIWKAQPMPPSSGEKTPVSQEAPSLAVPQTPGLSEVHAPEPAAAQAPAPDASQAPDSGAVRAPGAEAQRDATQPQFLVLALEFIGELEDDYAVVLMGEAPRSLPAELVIHHRGARGGCTHILRHEAPIEDIPGKDRALTLRCAPREFAQRLLSSSILALLPPLFALRTEDREIYVHIEGRAIRIDASRTLNADELKELLVRGANWIQAIRSVSPILSRRPGPEQ